jgi:hypothetical protein
VVFRESARASFVYALDLNGRLWKWGGGMPNIDPVLFSVKRGPKEVVFKDINTRGPYMIAVATDNVVYTWSDENVAFTGRTGDNTVPRYLQKQKVFT